MRLMAFSEQISRFLTFAGLSIALTVQAAGAGTPVRTTNTRLQTTLPSAPVPDPLMTPSPGGLQSSPVPLAPSPAGATPVAPVPPPDQGGPMYSQPLGSSREIPPPPPKQYLGDPGGFGSATPTFVDPLDPYATGPVTDRFGIAPPPGTLGRTYQRRSQLLDEKKHPRIGIVEVHLSENYDVYAKGLKSKWTGKVWQLESDPLLPGIPHIFDVVAEWGPEGAKRKEVRAVRLIMGRIVDLEF